MINKFHLFHIVNLSPWPILSSIQIFSLVIQISLNTISKSYKNRNLIYFINTVIISIIWWNRTTKEANKEGFHLNIVIKGLKIGILLFILSEVMFFLRFFWSYFHSGVSPNIELGQNWPPNSIETFNPINVPLLNTIILIRSGFSITWAHHLIIKNNLFKSKTTLLITCILGVYFTVLQIIEYIQSQFSIWDSTYGAIFFITTGFHGIHVIIGSTFLCVNLILIKKIVVNKNHHMGFELAAWYWHFVDVVWLFLYLSVYWWGK